MAMRVTLPTHPDQIKLRKFIDYKLAGDDISRVIVATGKKRAEVMTMKPDTIRMIIHHFETVIEQSTADLKRHIKLRKGVRSVRLSFIPSLESMSLAEHVDLDELSRMIWKENRWNELEKFMAILYRPVAEKLGSWYNLKQYDSAKNSHQEFIEYMNMDQVNSALLFFSAIANELVKSSQESLAQTVKMTAAQMTT